MIIAGVLEQIFKGLTLTYNEYSSTLKSYKEVTKPVQYHWGDSKELSKWLRARNGKQKFPLIWYVLEQVDNAYEDTVKAKCRILIMTSTRTEYYNNTRALINYRNIIEPLTTIVFRLLDTSNSVSMIYTNYEAFYTTLDFPNYGVDYDKFDFKSNLPKGTNSIAVDIVDARQIEFQARFNKNINCLM